jgi:hypothetical protein
VTPLSGDAIHPPLSPARLRRRHVGRVPLSRALPARRAFVPERARPARGHGPPGARSAGRGRAARHRGPGGPGRRHPPEPGRRVAGRDGALYREALHDLVVLQRESVGGARRAPCFEVAFDVEKLSWELHYFQKHFLEGLRAATSRSRIARSSPEAFHRLATRSRPGRACSATATSTAATSCPTAERLHWIDFQDARMGPHLRPRASLLRDSYVELPEELRGGAVRGVPRAGGAARVARRVPARFELMSVQRNLKALGTFGYMATVRGNDVYLPYVPHTLRCARRNLTGIRSSARCSPCSPGTWRSCVRRRFPSGGRVNTRSHR